MDYIAIPKSNGYQSLHTSVIGPHGVQIDVMIRTDYMDRLDDKGVAAEWFFIFPSSMHIRLHLIAMSLSFSSTPIDAASSGPRPSYTFSWS